MQSKGSQVAGFTLVELVIVIVVLAIISAYAIIKSTSPAEVTLPSQAETMASALRHTQALAYTSGQRRRVSALNGNTYSVAICGGSPITCPTTESTVTLQNSVTFTAVSLVTLDFNTLGQPDGKATFTLRAGGASKTVCVAAVTGLVSVQDSSSCP